MQLFQKPPMLWDFHAQQTLEFTQNGAKNKISSEQSFFIT